MDLKDTLAILRQQSTETPELVTGVRDLLENYAGLLQGNAGNEAAVREIAADIGDPETVRALIEGTSFVTKGTRRIAAS